VSGWPPSSPRIVFFVALPAWVLACDHVTTAWKEFAISYERIVKSIHEATTIDRRNILIGGTACHCFCIERRYNVSG
jgi:hypothetical protein